MDYDNNVLGVGNEQHPANQEETTQDELITNSLESCLDFYKVTEDSEPLENAIFNKGKVIEKSIQEIQKVITFLRTNGFDNMANILCNVNRDLKL